MTAEETDGGAVRASPTRRRFLGTLGGSIAGLAGLAGYAFGIEPALRLTVRRVDLALPGWPADMAPVTAALISDIHAIEPWMPVGRIAAIVAAANALKPDVMLLLGDFVSTMRYRTRLVMPEEWAPALASLRAPLGRYAILGNHDHWWPGGAGPVVDALTQAGIPTLVNTAVKLDGGGRRFWLAGTDSAYAPWNGQGRAPGVMGGGDDVVAALEPCRDDDPVLLMAHEPSQFRLVPKRVALTVSGHTHGGQVWLPFLGPPLLRRQRWVQGEYLSGARRLYVTAGLGVSIAPVRFLVPPEIVLLRIGPAKQSA